MKNLIGTFFFVGNMKPAPGTWGSLAALPFVWILHTLGGPWLLTAATLAVFFVGLWAVKGLIAETDNKDPSEIVIDEVAGMWIALLPASWGVWAVNLLHGSAFTILDLYPGWISAFLFFRLFDIWKPWLVGGADRRGDALGVMLDDVWAGIFAGLVTLVLAAGSHMLILPLVRG